MKKIIICGLPGTGKTTLANKIANENNFKYFNEWLIDKNLKFDNFMADRIKLSEEYSNIIFDFIKSHIEENIIFDSNYSILPKDYINLNSDNLCEIYYLGFDKNLINELKKVFKAKHPEDNDIEEKVEYLCDISEYCKNECEKYNIPFITIDKNRYETLNNLYEKILKSKKES